MVHARAPRHLFSGGVCLLLLGWTSITTGLGDVVGGDVNLDGSVNVQDVQLAINGALGSTPTTTPMDVNLDGSVNVQDVQLIINIALGSGPTAPIAPSGLAAAPGGTDTVDLTWQDNSSDERGFRVERALSGGTFAIVAEVGAGVTTFTDTGLNAATNYDYRIAAFNFGGARVSPAATAMTGSPTPAAVSQLAGTATLGQVSLTWVDNSANEDGFRVERSVAGGAFATLTTLGPNAVSVSDTNVSPSTTFDYRVIAFNAAGDGPASNTLTLVTPDPPPAAPSALGAVAFGPSDVQLSWTDNSATENGFRIERRLTGQGAFAAITIVAADVTSFTNSGLSPLTGYEYRVLAFNASGDSAPSLAATVTTTDTPPASATNLTASASSSTRILLTWSDNSANETGFRIERRQGGSGAFSVISSVGPNVMTVDDSAIATGASYEYRVVAFNAGGDAAPSNTASVTTPAALLARRGDAIYRADVVNGRLDRVSRGGLSGFDELTGLAFDPDTDRLYGFSRSAGSVLRIDPVGWVPTALEPIGFSDVRGLAFDTTSGTLYAIDGGAGLLSVDLTTGRGTLVGSTGRICTGLAVVVISGTPTLYSVDTGSNQLVQLSTTTGSATSVGTLTASGLGELAWHPAAGFLYSVRPSDGQLFAVNRLTAQATSAGSVTQSGLRPGGITVQPTALTFDAVRGTLIGAFDSFLATINPAGPVTERIGATGYRQVQAMAYDPATDTTYGVDLTTDLLLRIDRGTGKAAAVGLTGYGNVTALAFDTAQQKLYGAGTGQLIELDVSTGAHTVVGPVGFGVSGLAYDSVGSRLLGVDGATSNIFAINTTTGSGSVIVSNIGPSATGLAFDPAGNRALTNTLDGIRAIPLATGQPELVVAQPGGRYGGLAWSTADSRLYGFDVVTRGLHRFDIERRTVLQATGRTALESLAGDPAAGFVFALDTTLDRLVQVSLATGAVTDVGPLGFADVAGLARDPQTGRLFTIDNGGNRLLEIDATTGAATILGALGRSVSVTGLAFDSTQSRLLAFDSGSGELLGLDLATGAATTIGATGFTTLSGLTRNPRSDVLYAINAASGLLVTLDPGTGVARSGRMVGTDVRGLLLDAAGERLLGFGPAGELVEVQLGSSPTVAVGQLGFAGSKGLAVGDSRAFATTPHGLISIDSATGVGRFVGPGSFTAVEGLAFHPGTGRLLAAGSGGLLSLDPLTGAAFPVGSGFGGVTPTRLAFDIANGRLFGLDTSSSTLVSIDLALGSATPVRTIPRSGLTSLAFDDGELFTTASNGELLALSPTTGSMLRTGPHLSQSVDGLATLRPPAPPAAPSGLTAVALGARRVQLTWSDNSMNESAFQIERRVSGAGAFVGIAGLSVNTTQFEDTTAQPTTAYEYRVLAENSSGLSGPSNVATVTTPQAPPVAPDSLTLMALSATSVRVTWSDNSAFEDGFRIERRQGAGAFVTVGTVVTNVATFDDGGLSPATTYEYRVVAFNSGGDSASGSGSVTTPDVPPAAASSLTAAALSPTAIQLTWTDNANNEAGFKVQRRLGGTAGFATVMTLPADSTSLVDTGLAPLASYDYRVVAFNTAGDAAASNVASAMTPQTPPVAPSALAAGVVTANSVSLSWTDNSSNELGFRVERRPPGGTFATVASVAADTATAVDASTTPATDYEYRVVAFNSGGDSLPSAILMVTTPDLPPAAPAGLAATALSLTSVSLTWMDTSANESGFRLERRLAGGTFVAIANLGTNVTSFTDSGLAPATSYEYRLFAVNSAGDSAASNTATVTTLAITLAMASNLVATATGTTSTSLTWSDNSSNEDGFRLERRLAGLGSFAAIVARPADATSFNDVGLAPGTSYEYRVVVFNASGDGPPSNTATVTTLAGVPAAASGAQASPTDLFEVTVSWVDNSSTETGFRIERKPATGGSFQAIGSAAADAAAFVDPTPTPGVTYEYRVFSFNAAGDGSASNTSTLTVPALAIATLAGDGRSVSDGLGGLAVLASVGRPRGIAIDSAGDIYVSDQDSDTIQRLEASSGLWTRFAGTGAAGFSGDGGPASSAQLSLPGGMCITGGRLVFADINNQRIRTIDLGTGVISTIAGSGPTGSGSGAFAGDGGPATSARFNNPFDVAADAAGNLYVGDIQNHRIRRIDAQTGVITTVVGNGLNGYSGDGGSALNAALGQPRGVTIDPHGNIFFGDQPNDVIRRVDAQTGVITTVAGTGVRGFSGDGGLATAAQIGRPHGLLVDAAGNLTFVDPENDRIRRVSGATGVIHTLAGVGSAGSAGDGGPATSAQLNFPLYLAQSATSIVFTDFSGRTVRRLASPTATPPRPPENLAAATVTAAGIQLSWTDAATGETGYEVYRRVTGAPTYTLVASLPGDSTGFEDTGVSVGPTYEYRVAAVDSAGRSVNLRPLSAMFQPSVPAAPTSLFAGPESHTTIRLFWTDNATNEDSVRVERRIPPAAFSTLTTLSADTQDYTDSGLTPNTTYEYRIVMSNAFGDSPASNVSAATTLDVPPAAPTNLTATAISGSRIDLAWTDNATNEIFYRVDRCPAGTGSFVEITSLPPDSTSYSDTMVVSMSSYDYRVVARGNAGVESPPSNIATATASSGVPAAPSALAATATGPTSVTMNWTDNATNETSTRVERRLTTGAFSTVATLGANVTSFMDTGLAANTSYEYRVIMSNAAGDSSPSNVASVTTPANVPAAPTNLAATAISPSRVDLTWTDNSTTETSFRVERGAAGSGTFAPVATVAANLTSFSDTTAQAMTSYDYRVIAVGASGDSMPSNTATVTTASGDPMLSGLAASLSWTEDTPALVVAPSAIITDPDSASFQGGSLSLSVSPVLAADELDLPAGGTIAINAQDEVTVSGALVGTVTGRGTSNLSVSFTTAAATPSAVQTLLRAMTFRNISNTPSSSGRVLNVTVVDDTSGLASAGATLSVVEVNDPPLAVADTAEAKKNQFVVVDVLANDSDPEGQSLAVSATTQGANGGVTIGSGGANVTYTPAPGFFGTDSFTVTVSDGSAQNGTATSTVTVTVINTGSISGKIIVR